MVVYASRVPHCCVDIRQIFAVNLRKARNDRGLSQEELASLADLDRTYISALERGVYYATIKTIDQLARVLKVEPGDFLRKPVKSRKAE